MRNSVKLRQQLFIPKFCQQPRSRAATRPRRDLLPGSDFCLSSCKDASSSLPPIGFDVSSFRPEDTLNGTAASLSASSGSSNDLSTGQNKHDHSSADSNTGPLLCTPSGSVGSQSTESCSSWTTPGSVVWAKIAGQVWWPAKVMDESELQSESAHSDAGQVLVQFFQTQKCYWVDSIGNLSPFDECFEERSSNPQEEFQDALKEALQRREQISDGSPSLPKSSVQNPSLSEKWQMLNSSRAEDDDDESGRGKRKRKPKVHFDDVNCPAKSIKRTRRLKIMRYLGLTPPFGSPFPLPTPVRAAYK